MSAKVLETTIDGPGFFQWEVVGTSHYSSQVKEVVSYCITHFLGGVRSENFDVLTDAWLESEPGNLHDPNAIAVYVATRKVGHLSRQIAASVRRYLKSMGYERIRANCKAKLTYRSFHDAVDIFYICLDWCEDQFLTVNQQPSILHFRFELEDCRHDLEEEFMVIGHPVKFWCHPGRADTILVYPQRPPAMAYVDPENPVYPWKRIPLGQVPAEYVDPIDFNLNGRGSYEASIAGCMHGRWLIEATLKSKGELDRIEEEDRRQRELRIQREICKPYHPRVPVRVSLRFRKGMVKQKDSLRVLRVPDAKVVSGQGWLPVLVQCIRTKEDLTADCYGCEILIKLHRLLLTHKTIDISVMKLEEDVRFPEFQYGEGEIIFYK